MTFAASRPLVRAAARGLRETYGYVHERNQIANHKSRVFDGGYYGFSPRNGPNRTTRRPRGVPFLASGAPGPARPRRRDAAPRTAVTVTARPRCRDHDAATMRP